MSLFIASIIIYIINIPFGYWRANVKRYSGQWILAVHIPVPFVILLRINSDIGFELYTYFILAGAFLLGQYSGKVFSFRRRSRTVMPTTSCIIMDLYRLYSDN